MAARIARTVPVESIDVAPAGPPLARTSPGMMRVERCRGRLRLAYAGAIVAATMAVGGCSAPPVRAERQGIRVGSEIIPPERRTTWNPGLNAVGGIPFRSVVYTTIDASGGDDTGAIQTALDACPPEEVVKLGPGTFHISGSGLEIRRSRVVLRGSGPAATRLVKARGTGFPVLIIGQRWYRLSQPVPFATDAVKEASSVTLAFDPGLVRGELVHVDETYDPALVYYNPATQDGDYQGWGEGRKGSRDESRPIGQAMEVASVSGNTVTFTTP